MCNVVCNLQKKKDHLDSKCLVSSDLARGHINEALLAALFTVFKNNVQYLQVVASCVLICMHVCVYLCNMYACICMDLPSRIPLSGGGNQPGPCYLSRFLFVHYWQSSFTQIRFFVSMQRVTPTSAFPLDSIFKGFATD